MSKRNTVFINSSDYSTIYEKGNCVGSKCTKVISFYYGYEHRENGEYDGQYLFVAKIDGNVINSYTKSQIEENSTFKLESMSDYLQVGIFMHLNDFKQ